MLDDLRSHDPRPTPEEKDWMRLDPLEALSRAVLMAGIAMAVGAGAGILLDEFADSANLAKSDARHNGDAEKLPP
jgi:hypothetical protein